MGFKKKTVSPLFEFRVLCPKTSICWPPGRGSGGGQCRLTLAVYGRKHSVIVGLLVSLAPKVLKSAGVLQPDRFTVGHPCEHAVPGMNVRVSAGSRPRTIPSTLSSTPDPCVRVASACSRWCLGVHLAESWPPRKRARLPLREEIWP